MIERGTGFAVVDEESSGRVVVSLQRFGGGIKAVSMRDSDVEGLIGDLQEALAEVRR